MNRVFILPLLLCLISCSILNEDSSNEITSDNLIFRTDKKLYKAELLENLPPEIYGFTLIARFENNTGKDLFLNRCDVDSPHPRYMFKLNPTVEIDRSQTPAYNLFFACPGHHNPISVKSGTVRIDTLNVIAPQSWDHATREPLGLFEGTFQLLYDVWTCKTGAGCDLPDSLSLSNEFEVRLQE